MDRVIAIVFRFATFGALMLVCGPMGAQSQSSAPDPNGQIVTPVRARKLAGYVHMAIQKNTAVARVLVEEYDASWDRVLGSTYTDYYGHFSLKPAHGRKIHYLRLTAKGFAPSNYAVTLSSDAPAELMLELKLSSDPVEAPYHQAPGVSYATARTPAASASLPALPS